MIVIDLDRVATRELNSRLHAQPATTDERAWKILNPNGKHALAVGLTQPLDVLIEGHAGYYCGGMNQQAAITINGHCGWGVGENIMSGVIRVKGNASESAGASGHGGMVVIEGDASSRCGISMKGVDIVVGGSVGHMSAFLAQAGRLVVCGDAEDDLGDSIYEAVLYVRGRVGRLGADCIEKEMTDEHVATCGELLARAGNDADPAGFRRYGSARQLYHFHVDHADASGSAAASAPMTGDRRSLRPSASFPPQVLAEIHRAADQGVYEIRGFGAKRALPSFDDLLFLGASMSRYPLEGYRERCDTDVVLGTRFASKPIELKIPITFAGMSFGALGTHAKEALGRAATELGTSTTTGDGGMTAEERQSSKALVYQVLPSRYGLNPDDLRRCDAIEVVVGQGAKPGGGGVLLGHKVSPRVADMRTLPEGIDQRSACRHPDWTGPDDLTIKIQELREITAWEKPIYIKIGASRPRFDIPLAVKAGADVIVLDGMQGGTAATQDVFIEHVGIPLLPAVREAVAALLELDMHRKVHLVVSGGIRTGADVAKALALGADAVSIGSAALVALGCNKAVYIEDYHALGTEPGYCHHCHTGRCPVGVTTQDPALESRLKPEQGARWLANYLNVMVLELQTIARACGKSHVLNLEPEDMVALTVEAAAMAGVPLAGTDWIPGRRNGSA